jgi:hypothetical protein
MEAGAHGCVEAHFHGSLSECFVCVSVQVDADVPLSEVEGEDESPDYSYRLVGVVMHQGASPNSGL